MPRTRILALLLLAFTAAGAARADELRTLSGKTVTGTLANVSDTEITLNTDDGPVGTPLSQALALDVREIKAPPADAKFTAVQLVDESVLRCKAVTYAGRDVELTLLSGTTLKLPLNSVASVLRDAGDAALQKQWEQAGKQAVRSDRIFVLREGQLNALEGTLGDVDAREQTIQFKIEGAPARALPLARIQGLMFLRTDLPTDSPVCKVIDEEGNTLTAAKLGYDGTTLTVTTTFGAKLPVKHAALARLDFNLGRLTFLSDLDGKVTPSPWLAGFAALRRDVNLDGNPIALQDRQFTKGLSMYAGVEVEYTLGGKYKEFKAYLGADPRIAEEGQGKVTVSIYCDGQRALTKEVSAKEMTPLALQVKDVNTLRIVVSGQDFTGYSGHATLAEARVSQ